MKFTIKILILSLLISFFSIPAPVKAGVLSRPPTNLGLVGYWPMDEGVGGKTGDSSGNGSTGTITGASWSSGKHGKSLSFDGVNDNIIIGDPPVLNFGTNDFSASVWVNSSETDNFVAAMDFTNNNVGGWKIEQIGALGWMDFVLPLNQRARFEGFTNGVWHNIVGVRSGSTISIYVDGVKGTDNTDASNVDTDPNPAIGFSFGNVWAGKMDDIRIYNRALTQAEISKLYTSPGAAKIKKGTAYVQSAGSGNQFGVSAVNVTLNGVAAGNCLVLGVGWIGASRTIKEVVDDKGNTWVISNNSLSDGSGGGATAYASNVSSGNTVITASIDGGTATMLSIAHEVSGCAKSNAADGNNGRIQVSPPTTPDAITSNSITTTARGDYIFGFSIDALQTTPPNAGTNFTNRVTSGIGRAEDQIQKTSGSVTATFTETDAFSRDYTLILALKPAFQNTIINTSPTNKLTNGLVGYWTFDGKDTNWGNNTTIDRSGQGNTGTITNMSTTTSPTIGKIGQGFQFDGVDDYVDAGSASSITLAGEMSISTWVHIPNISGEKPLISNANNLNGNTMYNLEIWTSKVYFIQGDNLAFSSASNGDIVAGAWYHLGIVRSGSSGSWTIKYYINGTLDKSVSTATNPSAAGGGLKIGRADAALFGGGTTYGASIIDEARVYNRALSASEIKQLYNMGR